MPYKFVIIVIRSVKISNFLANNLQTKANTKKIKFTKKFVNWTRKCRNFH